MRCICTMPNTDTSPLVASTAANPRKTLLATPRRIGSPSYSRQDVAAHSCAKFRECAVPGRSGIRRSMRPTLLAAVAAAALAACGPAAVPGRAQVPGLDRVSGEVAPIEVDLSGAELASVRGPSGWVLVGAALDSARAVGGAWPVWPVRRTP